MKTIKFSTTIFLLALFAFTSNFVMAQGAKTPDKATSDKAKTSAKQISKFEAGKALSADDINFLNLITEAGKTRGKEAPKDATVDKTTFKAGQKISAADAAAIKAKLDAYNKKNKPETAANPDGKTRGGNCYYYCYYDYYGNYICYWTCY